MSANIAVFAGDGIGPEIVAEAIRIVGCLRECYGFEVELEEAEIGGAAIDATGEPLPDSTLRLARQADAVLLGAVGGPKWECHERARRPEQGLLAIRAALGLFGNLRPARLYAELAGASTLRPEIVADLDMMIVRELTGGLYFGEPRGVRTLGTGEREGYNTLVYRESEIARVARLAFEIAGRRSGRLCSVDKANVLEASGLWREVVTQLAGEYPAVELSHLYVDNAAMQLVRAPKQFDVVVTSNLFGDILSDCAAMLTGSIGMLPSASLDERSKGMYEPVHGSAPDIAGQDVANPLATILSLAMMLRYSLHQPSLAERVEAAVHRVLADGYRTADIHTAGTHRVGTREMGEAVVAALRASAG